MALPCGAMASSWMSCLWATWCHWHSWAMHAAVILPAATAKAISEMSFQAHPRSWSMLARVLMALSVSGAGMSLARADIDDAAARAQYLGRYEVSTGLRAIQRALYWTGFSGDESFEKVEEACWDAARMVKTDEQDLRDDACLTAAARAASPKIAYHRTRMLPGPGPSAGIGSVRWFRMCIRTHQPQRGGFASAISLSLHRGGSFEACRSMRWDLW